MAATAAAPRKIIALRRTRRSHWVRVLRKHGVCADCARKIAEAK
jgi:hypothetical protein